MRAELILDGTPAEFGVMIESYAMKIEPDFGKEPFVVCRDWLRESANESGESFVKGWMEYHFGIGKSIPSEINPLYGIFKAKRDDNFLHGHFSAEKLPGNKILVSAWTEDDNDPELSMQWEALIKYMQKIGWIKQPISEPTDSNEEEIKPNLLDQLNPCLRATLQEIVNGLGEQEVARKTGAPVSTVKSRKKSISRILGVEGDAKDAVLRQAGLKLGMNRAIQSCLFAIHSTGNTR